MKTPIIAPSILAADVAKIQREVEMLNASQAGWIQLAVMNGAFVPNISFGFPVCKSIHRYPNKPVAVHLMITQPENYVDAFKNACAGIISVHYEACPHLHRNLQQLKDLGVQAGVAINPHTRVNLLRDVIHQIDLVCLMSVNPGFGGQTFIKSTYEKVQALRSIIDNAGAGTKIEVDGGITIENAKPLLEAGADVLVAGSFVFRSENAIHTIYNLKNGLISGV